MPTTSLKSQRQRTISSASACYFKKTPTASLLRQVRPLFPKRPMKQILARLEPWRSEPREADEGLSWFHNDTLSRNSLSRARERAIGLQRKLASVSRSLSNLPLCPVS